MAKNFPTPSLIVILGATATGKTALTIALAKILNLPVISADSRQVYQYLDIGTAKPTLAERQDVPHYMLDVVPPDYNFTVAEYQHQTQALIQQFHAQGVTPLLVGGTGLYIKAIVDGLIIPQVPPQPELRQQLASLGQSICYEMLNQWDPATAQKIHPHDQHRTLRALEVIYTTGKPMSSLQGSVPPPYPILQIGITQPPHHIYRQSIHDRLLKMLAQGWLEEIQWLEAKYGADLPLLRTIGYGEMQDYLHRKLSLAEAISKAVTSTYQFAKRQRIWFQADQRTMWISPRLSDLLDLVNNFKDRQVHPHNDTAHHSP
ncbi:MAG: tRNA (adenosine(37)-N6)-dimethylallyltransferase MiaA [Pseudanabaenaceae cyanobacterium]